MQLFLPFAPWSLAKTEKKTRCPFRRPCCFLDCRRPKQHLWQSPQQSKVPGNLSIQSPLPPSDRHCSTAPARTRPAELCFPCAWRLLRLFVFSRWAKILKKQNTQTIHEQNHPKLWVPHVEIHINLPFSLLWTRRFVFLFFSFWQKNSWKKQTFFGRAPESSSPASSLSFQII